MSSVIISCSDHSPYTDTSVCVEHRASNKRDFNRGLPLADRLSIPHPFIAARTVRHWCESIPVSPESKLGTFLTAAGCCSPSRCPPPPHPPLDDLTTTRSIQSSWSACLQRLLWTTSLARHSVGLQESASWIALMGTPPCNFGAAGPVVGSRTSDEWAGLAARSTPGKSAQRHIPCINGGGVHGPRWIWRMYGSPSRCSGFDSKARC